MLKIPLIIIIEIPKIDNSGKTAPKAPKKLCSLNTLLFSVSKIFQIHLYFSSKKFFIPHSRISNAKSLLLDIDCIYPNWRSSDIWAIRHLYIFFAYFWVKKAEGMPDIVTIVANNQFSAPNITNALHKAIMLLKPDIVFHIMLVNAIASRLTVCIASI